MSLNPLMLENSKSLSFFWAAARGYLPQRSQKGQSVFTPTEDFLVVSAVNSLLNAFRVFYQSPSCSVNSLRLFLHLDLGRGGGRGVSY